MTLTGTNAIDATGNSLNNVITGNSASNTLTGGTDIDQFFYDTNAAFSTSDVGRDRITDFTSGSDRLVLDKTTFTALTSIAGNGFSAANEFAVVTSGT